MSEMTEIQDDRPPYDPTEPAPPARRPPHRQTAPQSEFTRTQVVIGFVILLVGLLLTFGLSFALA